MNCKKYDYEADDDVTAQIRAMIVQRKLATRENFANAREVRNLFEEIITNQARRVAAMENPGRDDMKKILIEDLVETAEADAEKTMKKAEEQEASRKDGQKSAEDGGESAEDGTKVSEPVPADAGKTAENGGESAEDNTKTSEPAPAGAGKVAPPSGEEKV